MKHALPLPLALVALVATGCPETPNCDDGLIADDSGACVPPSPAGCGAEEIALPGEEACLPIGWRECGAFSDEGEGCVEACREGDLASCRAAGRIPCADGFVEAEVGCAAIVPSSPCEGDTRPALGNESCAPVGDCEAPFPPAGATIFVDDDYADEQLDGTHFRTIADAVAAAGAGDVIAVESGTYAGGFEIPRRLEIVGRCAAEVVVEGPGNPGVLINDVSGVALRDLTVRGFELGVEAVYGSEVTLERVVLVENTTSGMFVLDAGTSVVLRESVVRDSLPDGGRFGTGVAVGYGASLLVEESAILDNFDQGVFVQGNGSAATVRRSVVMGTRGRANGTLGWGLAVQEGGSLTVEESLVRANRNANVTAAGQGNTLVVRSSVVDESTGGDDIPGTSLGIGINAQLGTDLVVEDTTARHNRVYGVRVGEAGSTAVLTGLVVDGAYPDAIDDFSTGLMIEQGASVVLEESFVRNPVEIAGTLALGVVARATSELTLLDATVAEVVSAGLAVDSESTLSAERLLLRDFGAPGVDFGYGLSVSRDASADVQGLGIVRARSSAFFVDGASAEVRAAHIRDTQPGDSDRGRGVSVQLRGSLSLSESRVEDNQQVAVFAHGSGSTITITNTAVRRTSTTDEGEHGTGVQALGGALVVARGVEIQGSEGVGALFAGAGGVLERTRVVENRVGIHVQDGTELREAEKAPDAPDPASVVVAGSEFRENETRVGSGTRPLPEPTESLIEE